MPLQDPTAGSVYICIITCLLFVCVFAGGICLVLAMLLPESVSTSHHLFVSGIALIGIPWFFWSLTFFYRIISRACGFRMGGVAGRNVVPAAATLGADNSPKNSSQEQGMIFGEVVNEESGFGDGEDRKMGRSLSVSSIQSHESQIPLATSMAS